MLRNLWISLCLICGISTLAQAQVGITPIKTTEKQEDKIDYKQTGAPLPPFILITVHDTAKKADTAVVKDVAVKRKKKIKNKHRDEEMVEKPNIYLTEKDFNNGANLFVVMFNPTCSHCEEATHIIEKNSAMFKKSKVVMFANKVQRPYVPDFVARLHTDNYPNIVVGMDSTTLIDNLFLYQMLPQINIYSPERKLLKIFKGDISIDSLQKYIQ